MKQLREKWHNFCVKKSEEFLRTSKVLDNPDDYNGEEIRQARKHEESLEGRMDISSEMAGNLLSALSQTSLIVGPDPYKICLVINLAKGSLTFYEIGERHRLQSFIGSYEDFLNGTMLNPYDKNSYVITHHAEEGEWLTRISEQNGQIEGSLQWLRLFIRLFFREFLDEAGYEDSEPELIALVGEHSLARRFPEVAYAPIEYTHLRNKGTGPLYHSDQFFTYKQ
ncbi:MAG: hypothetical protein Q4B29_00410 [Candidatus Saccharibacteria bacterium]|nr:hypothetical protein [Candidatus Saccharibacteria bacterium]